MSWTPPEELAPADRWDERESDQIADLYMAALVTTPLEFYEERKYWGMKILRHRNQKAEKRKK